MRLSTRISFFANIDHLLSRFVNLAILAVMAAVCAIVDSSLEKKFFPLDAPWLFSDDHSDDNPKINGLITLVFAFLT